jgi:hypothetical protein
MEEKNKIEIVEHPIKKIIVLSTTQLSLEEFFKRMDLTARALAMTGQPFMLNWAEGIIFLVSPYAPDSDIIIEDALEGVQYFASLVFASMPRYEPTRKLGALEIPIIDQTSLSEMKQIAQWLKNRIKG